MSSKIIIQKGDLAATSFSNDNTNALGGIKVRVDAGSDVGDAIAAAVGNVPIPEATHLANGTNTTVTGTGTAADPFKVAVPAASLTKAGVVDLNSMQVLGAGDKVINGVRVGKGGGGVSNNTVVGAGALAGNTSGVSTAAFGSFALSNNVSGSNLVAVGAGALYSNKFGWDNTAVGEGSQHSNEGDGNTSFGHGTLNANIDGSNLVAVGDLALEKNTSGWYSVGVGAFALAFNTTGSCNSVFGSQFTSLGVYSPAFNCTTESNRVSIAHTGVTNAYIQVAWTVVSDERDKEILGEVPLGLAFINKLSTIKYRYKESRDAVQGHGPVRYGFSAQKTLSAELEIAGEAVVVDTEDEDKLRFNDQAMIAALTNAVNELTARIAALEAK